MTVPFWILVSSSIYQGFQQNLPRVVRNDKENVHTTWHNAQDKLIPHKRVKSVFLLSTWLHWGPEEKVVRTLWRNQERLPGGGETLAESWRNTVCQAVQEGQVI